MCRLDCFISVFALGSCVLIQLLEIEQQYYCYGAGDTTICEVEYRPEE